MSRSAVFASRLLLAASFGATVVVAAPPVFAQEVRPAAGAAPSEGNKEEAQRRARNGVKLFNEGDYKLALIEFERAYDLVPNFRVLYNIGQVHFEINNYAKALVTFQRYLKEGGDDIDPARRAEVERDVATLKGRTAHLSLDSNVPGAELTLDDEPVGKLPVTNLLIDAGTHRLLISKEAYRPARESISLAGGEAVSRSVTLTLMPVSERIVVRERGTPAAVWVSWSATALFAVGTLTSSLFLVNARSQREEALKRVITTTERDALDDKVSDWTTVTIVAAGATAAAAGVALFTTLTSSSSESTKTKAAARVRPYVGPQALGVFGTF